MSGGFPYKTFRREVLGADLLVPALRGRNIPYIHFDNAASTPALKPIMEQMQEFLAWYSGVHRGTGHKSILCSKEYEKCHTQIGHFVQADLEHDTVILVKNTTEAINKLAYRLNFSADDVVVTSEMEHHSNDLPWRRHARVIYTRVDEKGLLDYEHLETLLRQHYPHVKLVSITGASNVTGHLNNLDLIARLAHEYNAEFMVDAAQLAPHHAINMYPHHDPRHIDYLAFSGHKIYAPFGIGVLIGSKKTFLQGEPDIIGGGTVNLVTPNLITWAGLPDREEAGSPNVMGAFILAKTLEYLQSFNLQSITAYENMLTAYALEQLQTIPGIIIYGAEPRLGVISFNLESIIHSQLGAMLSFEAGIGVRTGCFCAQHYVRKLLDENTPAYLSYSNTYPMENLPGMVRISLAAYNTHDEIDRLIRVLKQISDHPNYYCRKYPYSSIYGTYYSSGENWHEFFGL
ncbi:MAG: aminotransferase class V-fold PLP-dependent enzyme [Syntrophomonadaceae bacterium]|jgi:cysteine desulfurase/selenocysteine lyase